MTLEVCDEIILSVYGHYCVWHVPAPSQPTNVVVASNVTDSITIQWASPVMVFYRVDRYYVLYRAASESQGDEIIIKDVNNSYDLYKVNLLSILFVFTSGGFHGRPM